MDIHSSVGLDHEGDPCLYLQVLGEDSEHVRYLTEVELDEAVEGVQSLIEACRAVVNDPLHRGVSKIAAALKALDAIGEVAVPCETK